jgi:hypothetical protein
MAGTAFLPWEKWIAQLLHPLAVAVRRWLYERRRRRLLAQSEGWPETEGTIHSINWDTSFPREEILYSYNTVGEYYSGSCWHWFDRSDVHEVKTGDRIVLRYSREDPEKSVFLTFK